MSSIWTFSTKAEVVRDAGVENCLQGDLDIGKYTPRKRKKKKKMNFLFHVRFMLDKAWSTFSTWESSGAMPSSLITCYMRTSYPPSHSWRVVSTSAHIRTLNYSHVEISRRVATLQNRNKAFLRYFDFTKLALLA